MVLKIIKQYNNKIARINVPITRLLSGNEFKSILVYPAINEFVRFDVTLSWNNITFKKNAKYYICYK